MTDANGNYPFGVTDYDFQDYDSIQQEKADREAVQDQREDWKREETNGKDS